MPITRIVNEKPFVMVLASTLALLVLCASLYGLSKFRTRTFHAVKDELEKIPNVNITDIGGHFDDGLELEDVYAEVEVSGNGPVEMRGMTRRSFRDGGQFSLKRVGPWVLAVNRADVPRRQDSLGFGKGGEAHELLPAGIDDVNDVLMTYSSVLSSVETWPRYPALGHGSNDADPFTYSLKSYGDDTGPRLTKIRPRRWWVFELLTRDNP